MADATFYYTGHLFVEVQIKFGESKDSASFTSYV